MPEDLKLSEYNTIAKLSEYLNHKISPSKPVQKEIFVPSERPVIIKEEQNISQKIPEEFLLEVKNIIAEQTGYTVDILDNELDLEADLGIDTVKQVDIFGKISAKFNLQVPEDLKLSEYNTIAKLSEYLNHKISPSKSVQKEIDHYNFDENNLNEGSIKRYVIKVKEINSSPVYENIFKNKTFLVTKDTVGFSDIMIGLIRQNDGQVITIGDEGRSDYPVTLNSLDAVERVIKKILLENSEINGFIHLAPIDYYFKANALNDLEINSSVKSFFIIIKNLYEQLNRPKCLIASISFNSVVFPYDDTVATIYPSFAGIAGMMKSIKKEMKNTIVKMVDFSTSNPTNQIQKIINTFLSELMCVEQYVETGYKDDQKYILSYEPNIVTEEKSFIKKNSTLLVSGGARGITFEIVKSLVNNYHVNLIILGRSDIQSIPKEFLSENADEQFIFSSLKDIMKGTKPVEIKKAVNKIIKQKENYTNIKYLQTLGVKVIYETVDITDYHAVSVIIAKYKNIDGIIHGAGIDESNYIYKKEFSSFNTVFDTKVKGTLNLIEAMNKKHYEFFIAFSSIAAKTGNEGQSDYSAANDMMGKILHEQKILHPEKIYKVIDWTAWNETGMAFENDTVKKVLGEIGIEFLSVKQGIDFFNRELYDQHATEVIFADMKNQLNGGYFDKNETELKHTKNFDLCLIDQNISLDKTSCESVYTFSLDKDLYLGSHYWNGVAVVPGTFAAEILIQNSRMLAPQFTFISMHDYNMHHLIKLLRDKPKMIRIVSNVISKNAELMTVKAKIYTDVTNFKNEIVEKDKLLYESTLVFGVKPKPFFIPEMYNNQKFDELQNIQSFNIQGAYHPDFLFLGPKMQTLLNVKYFTDDLVIGQIKYSDPQIFGKLTDYDFNLDPILFDAALQMTAMHIGIVHKNMGLPSRVDNLHLFRKMKKNEILNVVSVLKTDGYSENNNSIYDILVYDINWNLVLYVNNFHGYKVSKIDNFILKRINKETTNSNILNHKK